MKILITGATGFVGTEILDQALAHRYIEHIYVLTRKSLDQKYFAKSAKGKVTEIIHDDFLEYPEDLLRRLRDEGVEGCIWALGSRAPDSKKLEEERKIGISFPIAAAEAFAKNLATALSPQQMPKKKFPFRFVFISAWGAEQNQFRSLWIWNDSRKIKGAAEKGLFDVVEHSETVQGHKCFEVISLRAGQVINKGDAIGTILWEATVPSIASNRLAKKAIEVAMQGTGDEKKRILENGECLGSDWAMVNNLPPP